MTKRLPLGRPVGREGLQQLAPHPGVAGAGSHPAVSSHPATALVGTASDTQEALHLDFATGQPAHRRYARAKVIDQIFYIEGQGDPRAPD